MVSTSNTPRACEASLEGILADYRERESDYPPPPDAGTPQSPFPEDVFRAWRDAMGSRPALDAARHADSAPASGNSAAIISSNQLPG